MKALSWGMIWCLWNVPSVQGNMLSFINIWLSIWVWTPIKSTTNIRVSRTVKTMLRKRGVHEWCSWIRFSYKMVFTLSLQFYPRSPRPRKLFSVPVLDTLQQLGMVNILAHLNIKLLLLLLNKIHELKRQSLLIILQQRWIHTQCNILVKNMHELKDIMELCCKTLAACKRPCEGTKGIEGNKDEMKLKTGMKKIDRHREWT